MSRTWNVVLAWVYLWIIASFSYDWYTDKPASWLVWFYALLFLIEVFILCVRDAIRGEW